MESDAKDVLGSGSLAVSPQPDGLECLLRWLVFGCMFGCLSRLVPGNDNLDRLARGNNDLVVVVCCCRFVPSWPLFCELCWLDREATCNSAHAKLMPKSPRCVGNHKWGLLKVGVSNQSHWSSCNTTTKGCHRPTKGAASLLDL